MTGGNWQPPPPPRPGGQPPPPGGQPGAQGPRTQSFYELLQVDPTAHPTIIRYAYRFLAGIYHPDNNETGSSEVFRQITEAFKTLSDQGKRSAYDAKLGPTMGRQPGPAPGPEGAAGKGPNPLPHVERTSLSYGEVELRLAVLQLLLQARKKRVQTGGRSAKALMDVLGIDMAEMEFCLWYMREKGLIERQEAQFMITVQGVDYIVDQLSKTQIIDEGPKSVPNPPGGASLPAPTR